ncbi:type II toxin-antitoxin system VapC family toxin [Aquiflexum gelatinilyticum]|uniref:type II toxin-antitoxin system VapC family toxin n=1 Tax=Aquiflexum gelatinilyticum TaxID=2961943 RepID=UPI0021694C76|nr:type II toxin-antitoxin system VapC family toxin [Aquiflexum gelatinilyticum]MCS4435058.1 type II toxin-antitoxin system VapC family toxin [Aquiflexum gelatinilyticum]
MAKKDLILCDTNILIELLKNNSLIIDKLKSIGEDRISVSMVTAGELIFGALNKSEMVKINKLIELTHVLPVNETISSISLDLLKKYTLSHHLSLPDSLLAATAIFYEIQLFTLNIKDFKYIDGVTLWE